MCQIHHIRLLLSDYCNTIHTPITVEEIPVKKIKMINRNVCTSVTSFLRTADVKDILIICGSQNHCEAIV